MTWIYKGNIVQQKVHNISIIGINSVTKLHQ